MNESLSPDGFENYRKMISSFEEFELLQLYHLQREAMILDLSVFMTVLFGFIAVTYFVGSKLLRSQVIAISILYSFFALIIIQRTFGTMLAMIAVEEVLIGRHDLIAYMTTVVMLLGWTYSLWFMYQTRGSGGADETHTD